MHPHIDCVIVAAKCFIFTAFVLSNQIGQRWRWTALKWQQLLVVLLILVLLILLLQVFLIIWILEIKLRHFVLLDWGSWWLLNGLVNGLGWCHAYLVIDIAAGLIVDSCAHSNLWFRPLNVIDKFGTSIILHLLSTWRQSQAKITAYRLFVILLLFVLLLLLLFLPLYVAVFATLGRKRSGLITKCNKVVWGSCCGEPTS